MKFLILGTVAALLCFYAYTEDDKDLKREDIDLQLEEEVIYDPPHNDPIPPPNKQTVDKKQPILPSTQSETSNPVKVVSAQGLIEQQIVFEKEKKRSESAPKAKNNDTVTRLHQNVKQQRRLSMSQETIPNKTNGKKIDQRQKVNVKTTPEQPKQVFKPFVDSKAKEKQKSKPIKQPKQKLPRLTPSTNPPLSQQFKGKGYQKKIKTQKWYSEVIM